MEWLENFFRTVINCYEKEIDFCHQQQKQAD
jgi:hypothetical protein